MANMKVLKSHTITFLYLPPMLAMSIFSGTFIYHQHYIRNLAGPGGGGTVINQIFFDTITYSILIATAILLLALLSSSIKGFQHDLFGILAILPLAATGWIFSKVFFEQIRLDNPPGIVDIYPGTLLPPVAVGLLIIANQKWGLIRTRHWKPGPHIYPAQSTFSALQVIVALSVSAISILVWSWTMQNWVEPGFSREGQQYHDGFTTLKALSAGLVAKGLLAGGLLWLMQLVPMADRTRLFLLGSKGLLVLLMLSALSLGAPGEVGALVTAIVGLWLVATLYLLGPLAGIEVRFLPFQSKFVQSDTTTEGS